MGIRGRWAEKDVGEGLGSCKLEETRLEPGPRESWQTPRTQGRSFWVRAQCKFRGQ